MAAGGLLALLGLLRECASCRGFLAAHAGSRRERARVARDAADEESAVTPAPPEKQSSPAEDLFRASARRKKMLEEARSEKEEREDEAIEALKQAMETREIAQLEAAIKQAEDVGLKPSETQDARNIVVEEKGGGLIWINHVGQRSYEVEWETGDTVADLKKEIFRVSRVPYSQQVLKSGGADLGQDFKYLSELAATKNGKVPDVWLFDERDREDIIADEMDGEPYYSDDGEDALPGFSIVVTVVFGAVPFLYVVTQMFGLNPFEPEQAGKLFDLGELLGFSAPGQGMDNEPVALATIGETNMPAMPESSRVPLLEVIEVDPKTQLGTSVYSGNPMNGILSR